MNCITITSTNVVLIGDTEVQGNETTIQKPYSIRNTGEQFEMVPWLETHIGQPVPEVTLKNEHIISTLKADNNEILEAYLSKISGIDVAQPEIILHS